MAGLRAVAGLARPEASSTKNRITVINLFFSCGAIRILLTQRAEKADWKLHNHD